MCQMEYMWHFGNYHRTSCRERWFRRRVRVTQLFQTYRRIRYLRRMAWWDGCNFRRPTDGCETVWYAVVVVIVPRWRSEVRWYISLRDMEAFLVETDLSLRDMVPFLYSENVVLFNASKARDTGCHSLKVGLLTTDLRTFQQCTRCVGWEYIFSVNGKQFLQNHNEMFFIQNVGLLFFHNLSIYWTILAYHARRKLPLSLIATHRITSGHLRKSWIAAQPVLVSSMKNVNSRRRHVRLIR